MAAQKGRGVAIYRNGVLVAGARAKTITINGAPIDITTDDDDSVRKLLEQPGQVDVSISVEGILKDFALQNESLSTTARVKSTEFRFGGFQGSPGNTHGFTGQFFLSSLEIGAPYNEAVTFSAKFDSADTVTYVAPA